MCSAQLLFKPGKKDNEEGREEPQLCGAVGGRERAKERVLHSFLAPSGSLNTHIHTHTVRWNLSVAPGVSVLFRCSPPGYNRVRLGGGQDTDALLVVAGIAPPPSCLLALFFPSS